MKHLTSSVCALALALLPLVAAAQSPAKPAASRQKVGAESVAVLEPATAPAAPTKKAAARNMPKVLTGYVLNEEGEPLAGATVTAEKGETITTNADGQYVIQSMAATPVLRVSYAGYQEMQMPINTLHPTTFRLDPIEDYERQLKKRSKAASKAYRKP
ncbi:carboxypeptidase-like regulatory domain-containing protein [Hymenobacter elongatus]|uniref:Carboxypeptidase regulatory-like domain-containing protein n=1 Tax=Hymenobacter elongatus TaxID=877208 RepID=A0A4Z0PJ10_9BACT|nr:carboxypeptidase-like regulatory domain-containing protein [Hymenobacter elongatus]TGE15443.1 carboxypeptidase regulatory-like domain-containing protein [Hymenobacter elongatus]